MIISSCFAIPVSCTGGMFAGAHYLSHDNTVYFNEKILPHENFYVLATDENDAKDPLDYFSYHSEQSASDYLNNYPKKQFLINKSKGQLATDSSLQKPISFEVLSRHNNTQTIELHYSQDGETDTVIRYKATQNTIQPISQRSFSMALLFDAFPYALAFSILFSILGKVFLSLVHKKSLCLLPTCKS